MSIRQFSFPCPYKKKKRRKQKCNDIVTKRKEKKIEEEKTNQRATLVFLFHSIGGYFPDFFRFLFRGQNRVDFFSFLFLFPGYQKILFVTNASVVMIFKGDCNG